MGTDGTLRERHAVHRNSALGEKDIPTPAPTHRHPEDNALSETSQTGKDACWRSLGDTNVWRQEVAGWVAGAGVGEGSGRLVGTECPSGETKSFWR